MEDSIGQSMDATPVSSTPAVDNSAPTQSAAQERTFRQSEVNDLVKRVKHEAVESYRRMESEQPQYAAQKYGRESNNTPSALPESEIRRMAAEEAQRLRDDWQADYQSRSEQDHAQRIVKNFWDKVNAGKTKYDDFDAVTSDIALDRFPNTVQMLSEHIENAEDVMYQLGKDRFKMAQLEQLAQLSPQDAIVQAKRLAESLKQNADASRIKMPNAPLTQQRPSGMGTDGGVQSMADLKRKYKG